MTPTAIVKAAAADGVRLALTEVGTLKTTGRPDSIQHWLPRLREYKAEIIQLLEAANNPIAAPANHWLLHFANRGPVEVWYGTAVHHTEVLASYCGAVAAEPIIERTRTPSVTPHERSELLAVIAAIYADDTDKDRQEAIDAALADPKGALQCYRAIANERGITVAVAGARQSAGQSTQQSPQQSAHESAKQSAQESALKSAARGCGLCLHRKRPGLSSPGYCGAGRADLKPAYGPGHSLRRMPDDRGASCASYMSHEG